MTTSQIWSAVSIAVLVIGALLVLFAGQSRKENRFAPLAGLAFGFILAGLMCGEDRFVGSGWMGGGLILADEDTYRRSHA